jgi:hypothetical protein
MNDDPNRIDRLNWSAVAVNTITLPSCPPTRHPERIQVYVNQAGFLRRVVMQPLMMLGIVMVVLWAVLWLGLKIATGMIHVMLIVGLALVIWGLIKKGARAIT